MKPQTKNPKSLKSQGIEQSVKFGIKSSGLHHILGILRNQLYSDKILAVLREYSCNAVDAHAEAGCPERPIEVTLPNRMNPYYKVRDFGPALNEDDIQNIKQIAILSKKEDIGNTQSDAKQQMINTYEDYSERLFNYSMNPQEQLLDLLEQIKQKGINETNYSQMKSIILQL